MHTRNSGKNFFQTGFILLTFLFSTILYAQSPVKKETITVKNKPSPVKNKSTQKVKKQENRKKQSVKKAVLICDFCKNCPACTERRNDLKKAQKEKEAKKAQAKAEEAARKAEKKRIALLPKTPIDRILVENWKKNSISTPEIVSDEIFLRRVMLNVTGKIPSVKEVNAFLKSH